MALRATLIVIVFLLLAAHFMRMGHYALVALSLAPPFLLLVRKQWAILLLQVLCYFAAMAWIVIMLRFVHERRMWGLPWIRLVIILGAVSLFTALAGFLLNSRVVKDRYPS